MGGSHATEKRPPDWHSHVTLHLALGVQAARTFRPSSTKDADRQRVTLCRVTRLFIAENSLFCITKLSRVTWQIFTEIETLHPVNSLHRAFALFKMVFSNLAFGTLRFAFFFSFLYVLLIFALSWILQILQSIFFKERTHVYLHCD